MTGPSQATIILTTPRLLLRPACEDDIPILHRRIFSDNVVMRHVFSGSVMSPAESERFVRDHFTFGDRRAGLATLIERASGEVIGFAGLNPCAALGQDDFEIGFVLARSAWGQGFATEIGKAQLRFGLEDLGCARLLALADPHNIASGYALEKLGMRRETEVAIAGRSPRAVFVLTAEDWRRRG
ncbi:MAG TPA: GNAT family N-acetyltransferase [Tardiphaga sp.]